MEELQKHWVQACFKLNIPKNVAGEFWDTVTARYGENQRFYHTLDHLIDMFRHFESVCDRLQQPALVAMAIFFHDIIYEPTQKDNEEKSALLFQEFVQSALESMEGDSVDLQKGSNDVVDWINATKLHKTDVHTTPNMYGDSDLHYFLDMDMAILGTPLQDYKDYASKIRQEYCHYSEEAYRQGRAKVLKSFLTIPNIYATQIFRQKFESQARSNIEDEIQRLLQEDQ